MRIVRLQAEGFKRLVAVDITPDGDLVEVRGNNGNGKSSVLDAIYSALAGASASPEKPVRDGEEMAIIRLDLGDLVVTRYFTAEGTTRLKVQNAEGATFSSGQTMLDKLVGHISFDPLEFLSLKPSEQAEELRKLVDIADPETGEMIDLSAIEAANAKDFADRRDVNRDGKALKARIDGMGGVRHVPDDAPNRDEIVAKLASAGETNEAVGEAERKRASYADAIASYEARKAELETELANTTEAIEKGKAALAALPEPGQRVDVAELQELLASAENFAENKRHNDNRAALIAEFEEMRKRSESLSEAMAKRNANRAAAIAAAKMPVDGLALSLDDENRLGVTFNGVPFSQASDAERLRISAAVAMAANPELRVLRLKDASLLDAANVELLRELAKEHDFQVWAEFVGDDGPGIIMESGEVRGADAPEPLERPRTRKKAEAGDEQQASETPENGGKQAERGGDVADTLFGDTPQPERRKPRAMTEFNTRPKGDQ